MSLPPPLRAFRRRLPLLIAVLILSLTAGCQNLRNMLGLVPPRPAPRAVVVPPAAPPPLRADHIVVLKHQRLLELLRDGAVEETFPIALGAHPRGPKQREGDDRTPEGRYVIDRRSTNTRYTAELHISYPNAADRASAAARHLDPGGAIYIHGMPRDYGPFDPPKWYKDWTEGCVAVGNAAIWKIWDAVPDGTPIDIVP